MISRTIHAVGGITLVEVLIAILILVMAIVPMIGLFTGGREQAHMSEHQIYAELLCARTLEDISTRHYGFLYASNGPRGDFFKAGKDAGLYGIDKKEGWFDKAKEMQLNAWTGPAPIKSATFVTRVGGSGADAGMGLMSIKINATWGDIRMLKDKESYYSLLRLTASRDYGLRTIYDAKNEL